MAQKKLEPYPYDTPGGTTRYTPGGVSTRTVPLQIMPFAGGMGDVTKQLQALLRSLPKRKSESTPSRARTASAAPAGAYPTGEAPGSGRPEPVYDYEPTFATYENVSPYGAHGQVSADTLTPWVPGMPFYGGNAPVGTGSQRRLVGYRVNGQFIPVGGK